MKKGGGSESTISIGPSKSVLVYALHSLEYVQGLARFRVFVPNLLLMFRSKEILSRNPTFSQKMLTNECLWQANKAAIHQRVNPKHTNNVMSFPTFCNFHTFLTRWSNKIATSNDRNELAQLKLEHKEQLSASERNKAIFKCSQLALALQWARHPFGN